MTAGTHGSTFGGNPLATAVANAVLDVVTADGFLDDVRDNALRLKQRLAELKDRYPTVIAEVRSEGLLMGLRLLPPASAMVDELRAEKMLTPTAGDNVVRLLPPLIIGEEEISEAVARIDRACARLAQLHAQPAKVGAA
jgi:acetylornithine/N-succinyldiaminopimelate aminotransferase